MEALKQTSVFYKLLCTVGIGAIYFKGRGGKLVVPGPNVIHRKTFIQKPLVNCIR